MWQAIILGKRDKKPKGRVSVKLYDILDLIYKQQHALAELDKSFIRVLPEPGKYTREAVKEAIYYAQCAQIELYEYQTAKPEDQLDEAIDVAIFSLNVLAYLGCRLHENLALLVKPISNVHAVVVAMHDLLSEILYEDIDYKQWKFPKSNESSLDLSTEVKLGKYAELGLALATYQAIKACKTIYRDFSPKEVLLEHIQRKMKISRTRASQEVTNHRMTEFANNLKADDINQSEDDMTNQAAEVAKLRAELKEAKANASKNESAESADRVKKIEEQLKQMGCGTKRICD